MDCPVCGNEIDAGLSTCPYCMSPLELAARKRRQFIQRTINLEEGRPTVELAVKKLSEVIDDSTRRKISVLTLIHGYGSSGKGGKIRTEVRKMLDYMSEQGAVHDYIAGESFNKRSGKVKQLLQRYPQMATDKNLGRGNKGITIVVLPL